MKKVLNVVGLMSGVSACLCGTYLLVDSIKQYRNNKNLSENDKFVHAMKALADKAVSDEE